MPCSKVLSILDKNQDVLKVLTAYSDLKNISIFMVIQNLKYSNNLQYS